MYGKLPKNQEEISKGLNELVGELSKVRDNAVDNARTLVSASALALPVDLADTSLIHSPQTFRKLSLL